MRRLFGGVEGRIRVACALAMVGCVQCSANSDSGPRPMYSVGPPMALPGTGGTLAPGSGTGGASLPPVGVGVAGQGPVAMGAGGVGGTGGVLGTGGAGVAGMGTGGMGTGGMGTGGMGTGGMGTGGMGTGGMGAAGAGGTSASGEPTSGLLAGVLEEHNKVRAGVMTDMPLPPFTWSQMLADYAQEWADTVAMDCNPRHRTNPPYGENLAVFTSFGAGSQRTGVDAVDAWAAEDSCWTYGLFMRTDQCNQSCYLAMSSDGCGHYTQIVWRNSTQVGCGASTCMMGGGTTSIYICNYAPQGNIIGQAPY